MSVNHMLEVKYNAMLAKAENQRHPNLENLRVCFEVLALAAAINRDCAFRLGKYELSEGKFVLLFLLREQPNGLSPHDLAEQAGVSRATITGLLDGLEQSGFLARYANTEDRRKLIVRLTKQGWTVAQTLFNEHTQWISTLLSDFSSDERQILSKLLRKIWFKTDSVRSSQV
ncbi:MAG: transcriptional regulator, MarR family [Gammaproteobacteria bacterium]|jgi:DNA-binding MarR family transcriptional regulator|nr:transcriptional regulator, MarR family [Gammaproteobacteria bacterium]